MKRLPTSLIIFILTIGVCIFGLIYAKSMKNKFSETLQIAYDNAQNGQIQEAEDNVKEFKKDWEKNEKYLALFIDKGDLSEIEFSSRIILEYIKSEELPEFYAELKRVMALLDHLWEAEAPTLKNIL